MGRGAAAASWSCPPSPLPLTTMAPVPPGIITGARVSGCVGTTYIAIPFSLASVLAVTLAYIIVFGPFGVGVTGSVPRLMAAAGRAPRARAWDCDHKWWCGPPHDLV